MPGVSCVIPEEDLLKCGYQASHVIELASKQPREPRLEGRLILHCREAIANCQLKPDSRGLFHDVAVAHLHDAFTHSRGLRVMRDHDDGLIEPVIQLLKHVKDES